MGRRLQAAAHFFSPGAVANRAPVLNQQLQFFLRSDLRDPQVGRIQG